MTVIDTTGNLHMAFIRGRFDMDGWSHYMDISVPEAKDLCVQDMEDCVRAGYSWEKDFLPVLNPVLRDEEKRTTAIASFHMAAEKLEDRIKDRFGKTVDTALILYLGLCNGAGWVTTVGGKTAVLFGIEKIMELNWHEPNKMLGLVYHELGHVYHDQYGALHRDADSTADRFLWQLFTEGVAMVFEQELSGDPDAYHQYNDEWKQWCKQNAEQIKRSFYSDLGTMTQDNQRYFGDWVRFNGHGDTGYYLGAQFVRFLLKTADFDQIISYELGDVKAGFDRFLHIT